MDCLTREEVEERIQDTYSTSSGRLYFCPDCLSQLGEIEGDEGELLFLCPNEICLNGDEYNESGERR